MFWGSSDGFIRFLESLQTDIAHGDFNTTYEDFNIAYEDLLPNVSEVSLCQ